MHKILRALILSDLFLVGGFGLVQPIFAVFMLQKISGTTLLAIGVATSIQLITRSFFQIVVGKWTDDERGNKRELRALLVGSILTSLVPFGLAFSTNLSHVYFLQFVYGLGVAMAFPSWMVIFSRYSCDKRAGYEWSMYNSTINLGTAAAASLGAYLADFYSFRFLFVLVGVLSVIGTGFIVHIFQHEFTRQKNARK